MYFGPPPPRKDATDPAPVRDPDAAAQPAAAEPGGRSPVRESRAAEKAEADEREHVSVGRAIFCLLFLAWAARCVLAEFERAAVAEGRPVVSVACAVFVLAGVGLLVGGKSLFQLVRNTFASKPPPPRRRRRRPDTNPDTAPADGPPASGDRGDAPDVPPPAGPSDVG